MSDPIGCPSSPITDAAAVPPWERSREAVRPIKHTKPVRQEMSWTEWRKAYGELESDEECPFDTE